jgi:hypothetical protein
MTPTGGRKPHTLGRGKGDLKTLEIVIANAMHFTKNVLMVKITKAVRINERHIEELEKLARKGAKQSVSCHSTYYETVSKTTIHGVSLASVPLQQDFILGFSSGSFRSTRGILQCACQSTPVFQRERTLMICREMVRGRRFAQSNCQDGTA